MPSRAELQDILTALREVDANLERRYARAEGAYLVTWGLMGALGMAFYRVARPHPEAFTAVLGPFFELLFVAPLLVAFVVSLAIGARFARVDPAATRLDMWMALCVLLGGIAIVAAGRALGHLAWISAGLVLASATIALVRMRRRAGGPARGASLALAAVGLPLGVVLFFLPYTTAYTLTAIYWGVGWTGAGLYVYARGGG